MTYKTHLSTGLLFSSIVFLLIYKIELSPVLILTLIISTVIGSSAPDLDTPTGGLWHKIPAGSIISRIVHPIFIGGHRHLSHSFLGFGIFTGLFYLLIKMIPFNINLNLVLLAFVVGYLAHILADMFTEEGVPLFFPFGYHFGIPPNPFKKVRIKTGHWFENLIIYPVVNLALILVIYMYINR
jgi:inner membrane protein